MYNYCYRCGYKRKIYFYHSDIEKKEYVKLCQRCYNLYFRTNDFIDLNLFLKI